MLFESSEPLTGSEALPDAPSGDGRRAVTDVSPTWELELLISGAVIFALFQLPSAIDAMYERVSPHVTRSSGIALLFGYWYGKAIVYALIGSFIVHLVARAYWVGLVGLNSVYPRGARWEELKFGPIARELYRSQMPSLPAVIARTDNFCSVIFSFAFAIVVLFAVSILAAAVAGAIAYAIAALFFGGRGVGAIVYTIAGALAIPPMIAALVDRAYAGRLDPDGRAEQILRGLLRVFMAMQMVRLYAPITITLFSNVRKRVIYPVFYAMFVGLIVIVGAEFFARNDLLSLNAYDYVPEDDDAAAFGVDRRFYESQRQPGEINERRPTIQSDVITGPYLRLFIPYAPARHNEAVARACPGVEPLEPRGLRLRRTSDPPVSDSAAAAVLRCLATIHRVEVNGTPRPDLDFRFYTQPATGLRGIVGYIPTATLPRGRNVLTVQPAPRRRVSPEQEAKRTPQRAYVVPFWL